MSSDEGEPGEISSSRGSRHSSSRHHHHKEKDKSRPSAPTSSSSAAHNYKELYKDAKYELKRKKRDTEELDEQLAKQTRETKKAKQDTQDLWKIYYTLQQELQQGIIHKLRDTCSQVKLDIYEKNAKLQAEKIEVESSLQAEKNEMKRIKSIKEDPSTLKDALCNMQKEKMELQQKFNDIVLENKTLKDKSLTYEPRLREIDDLKMNLHQAHTNAHDIEQALSNLNRELNTVGVNKAEVEKYRRWNSLLTMESHQNSCKLRRLETFEAVKTRLENENNRLSTLVESQGNEIRSLTAKRRERAAEQRFRLEIIRAELRQLKMDWSWNGDAVKNDLNKTRELIKATVDLVQKLPTVKIECQKCADNALKTVTSSMSEPSNPQMSSDEKPTDPVGVVEALKAGIEQRNEAASELRKKIQFLKQQLMEWERDLDNYASDIVEVSGRNGSEEKEFSMSEDTATAQID